MARHRKHPRLDVQRPVGILCFLILVLLWFVGRLLSEQFWQHYPTVSRLSGYLAALCLLFPCIHILRRFVRRATFWSSTRWLSLHIAAAYAGFFFLLLHCRARAETGLTLMLLGLVWTVMLSGVVGFYGRKLLYRLLPHLVTYEYGLERLEPERCDRLESAYLILAGNQVKDWKKILAQRAKDKNDLAAAFLKVVGSEKELTDSINEAAKERQSQKRDRCRVALGRTLHQVLAWKDLPLGDKAPASATMGELRWNNRNRVCKSCPGFLRCIPLPVAEFCDEAIDKCLTRPFTVWRWAWAGKESNRLYENRYKRALAIVTEKADKDLVKDIWELVEKRRLLDLEYRLHALGRLWLLFHGPAALALLVFIVEHIWMSMRFGGF